ncbi:MAG: hypothetical protein DRI36_06245 [Caldiserica bacterium]|nr:MAG: hypothetical protein DRI36_06245 [Caldisericota bacterium]
MANSKTIIHHSLFAEKEVEMDKKERQRRGLLKIGEVAKLCGVPKSTIRYYTDMGILKYVARTPGGVRLYPARETLMKMEMIKSLNKRRFTLKEIIEKLKK